MSADKCRILENVLEAQGKDVEAEGWFPTNYTPGFSVDEWVKMLNDPEVFTASSLEIMKRMKDFGGVATCKQLADKYGESANFYNAGSSSLAKRIHTKTGCPVLEENTENSRWWPILYVGCYNEDKTIAGVYSWKFRPELSAALEQVDFSNVRLYASPRESVVCKSTYTKADFLSEVFMAAERYDAVVQLLRLKKNVILQGAPGVGKTYAAKRLAYAMMGEEDEGRIEMVQFHQNYSYEDFVMGYKPEGATFVLKQGVFYRFCQRAMNDPERDYFFIIDEINRGNMSKIFGELLMLIERDYRGKQPIKLAYSDVPFNVPENVHLVGMMNTADRSLAMIDYALRRRFSFFDIAPGFDSEGFRAYQQELGSARFDAVVEVVKRLNREIAEDKSLGKGFCIGHSYLCNMKRGEEEYLKNVVAFDILPMLAEYWFDETDKYERWAMELMDVFK
jgi:5-methylcytosine-specific restriction protein B